MASKLTERDRRFLDANKVIRVGDKPYEDGYWGSHENRDFVHFQLFDTNNNLMQFENLPVSQFSIEDSKDIGFYPGNHIRNLGFESGRFTIRYNFLRKLAGDEVPVLLHTVDKGNTSIGDVYANMNTVHITEDGLVYAGTEEEYNNNPTSIEQLAIEDLKYQIDEISTDRTEVRLKAKKINSSYIDDFIDIQTSIKIQETQTQINFIASAGELYDSTLLTIAPPEGGFKFTNRMVGGTLTIPGVYKVDEVEIPVKTDLNILKNSNGELIETDNLGNILNLQDVHEWDASLHDDAIKVQDWTDGFLSFGGTGIFGGTAAIGYHAKWVQGEGMAGGNCMKFTDQNGMFEVLGEWPSGELSRKLTIMQEMPNLLGQGVNRGDIVNVSMDVKSTIAGKGVQIALVYANEPLTETMPSSPPDGYWDGTNTGPTETQPTSPPDGFVANTSANASAIEHMPPGSLVEIYSNYPDAPNPFDIAIGESTVIWGGAGAWKIGDIRTNANGTFTYIWGPNLNVSAMDGTLSSGGQWQWVVNELTPYGQWIVYPAYANAATPPAGTVNNLKAINHHPFQDDNQGSAYFPRDTIRGENRGWQTGTQRSNDKYVLFKDDLVWQGKADQNNDGDIELMTIEEWANSSIFRENTVIGQDNITKSLYDDIFEDGFIQTVTRANTTSTGEAKVRTDHYIIFYNDGRGNAETSNKWFQMKLGNKDFQHGTSSVSYLKDLSDLINTEVNANDLKFEVTFWRHTDDKQFRYYWAVADRIHRSRDGNGNISNDSFTTDSDYPGPISNKFGYLEEAPDAFFPKDPTDSSDWSRFSAIVGETYYKAKSSPSQGASETKSLQEVFYNAGIVGTAGVDLTYGVRNPAALNYNSTTPIYDDGTAEFAFDMDPTKDGTLSPQELWIWNGTNGIWVENALMPPRYNYVEPSITKELAQPAGAGQWERVDIEISVAQDWLVDQKWYLYIYGHNVGGLGQGVVWVDNMYMDFTLVDESVTQEVYKSYSAQIIEIGVGGLTATVNKSFKDRAFDVGFEDEDTTTVDVYDISNPGTFDNFQVSYLNFNPKDLRTYLKFGNDLFLTTNFKQDKINVSNYPYSVVYKLYEPLSNNFVKFDECIVVKEMANPLEKTINIIDFVPEEEGKLVLKSPDLNNVESPVRRRSTLYKSETGILTNDTTVSSELRNEFLSQSLDSVKINTDYSRYENFINFSSIEKRIRNFKKKLENIEEYRISSGSYAGISGSSADINVYRYKIVDTKNKFDDFEKYMYFESSSYVSSSLGMFYDNSWPKTSGAGTLTSPYILAHTTSSQATTWFSNAMTSASLYDTENSSKLSNVLPEFVRFDSQNEVYLRFTDMIGQHFDHIWEYVNALSDTYDRRDKLTEGVSKDLLWNIAKSLGWNLEDGKDLVSLPRYALGKEVTGSAFSDYSTTSERDISREIWSRIINNMPFFLKNKGTVRALKGLINIYGIPSTILRVKEYGGPNVPDNETPQYEITRKFTKALDFRSSQYVKVAWADDSSTSRKPDTVEFRFRAATGSNQILVEKKDDNNQDWFIRLKDNGSSDNYGNVSFMLSGSQVGADVGQYKEISSSSLPVYDGDFYSVMVRRTSGSSNVNVSQSYELSVGKYDNSRHKIHLYTTTTMDVTQSPSASFSNAWTGSGNIYIGGSATIADVGVQFSGSIMEYRHWTETLQTSSFKNHISNPKAYDGNEVSSSYNNLVLRYSFDDNKDLSSDTEGIRDVSSNQTTTLSGSHTGFTGNFFRNIVDELKTHIPSIGALRRSTNKIRIESNPLKSGFQLSSTHRSTTSAYDTAPTDSNKVGIWFAPTDVINNDIINSVANLNFDNYLGDPRDKLKLNYRGLNYIADNYWKKYTSPNNFWDYIRLMKYYDQSMYSQLRKLVPARAKPDIGLLIEPNIFERPKVILGRTPDLENTYYSSSIDIGKAVDGLITITGSYNHGSTITNFESYTGEIDMYSYETGSSVVSASGESILYEASSSEARDRFIERSLWQRVARSTDESYANVTMSMGDTISGSREVFQPFISSSRIFGRNQKTMKFYSSAISASVFNAHSSSFYSVDIDSHIEDNTARFNLYYGGVKNSGTTTSDGGPPIEVVITSPTKLVTVESGDSTLETGEGTVPDFKEMDAQEKPTLKAKTEKRGLKKSVKPETDQDRKKLKNVKKYKKGKKEGKQTNDKKANK